MTKVPKIGEKNFKFLNLDNPELSVSLSPKLVELVQRIDVYLDNFNNKERAYIKIFFFDDVGPIKTHELPLEEAEKLRKEIVQQIENYLNGENQ